jgi:predicted nucleic acid-binding protein
LGIDVPRQPLETIKDLRDDSLERKGECGIFRQPMTESLAVHAARFVKKGLTGYDATYAALAAEMKGKWLTFDQKAHECLLKERISHDLTKRLPKKW